MTTYVMLIDENDGTALIACPDGEAASSVAAAATFSDSDVSAYRVPTRAYIAHEAVKKILRGGGKCADIIDEHLPTARREASLSPGEIADAVNLAALVETLGSDDIDLDDLVHDTASLQATAANNGGVQAQIEYLLHHLSANEVSSAIERMAG